MKKLLLIAIVLSIFQACNDDPSINTDDTKEPEIPVISPETGVVITDIQGNTSWEASKISFVARFHTQNSNVRQGVMLTMPFNEDETTLLFPDNPPIKLLGNITKDFPNGFIISDPEAKTIAFTEFALHDNEELESVYRVVRQMKTDGKVRYLAEYIYCDRPVTISGNGKDWWNNRTTYNLTLNKGWNLIIRKEDNTTSKVVTISNEIPEGLEWIYDYWLGR